MTDLIAHMSLAAKIEVSIGVIDFIAFVVCCFLWIHTCNKFLKRVV